MGFEARDPLLWGLGLVIEAQKEKVEAEFIEVKQRVSLEFNPR
ncbi:hypothetical protein COLO4_21355 [Corchorus olitorius]|uniref:Uncharacterized protein n=1 Tax=Corchorus olitorius TaxID=93759 RepID=A0A1R3ITU1_9ROSI|nr:hypothetical protein COLO4_21355 [Corchorus olitorius]